MKNWTFWAVLGVLVILAAASLKFCSYMPPQPIATAIPSSTATASPTAMHTPTVTQIVSAPTFTSVPPTGTSTPEPSPTATRIPPTATDTPPPLTATATPEAGCFIQPGGIYMIQPGDTVWRIAGCAYGDPSQYERICQANGLADCDLIHAGNSLIIPRRFDYG